jgi:hypothetical protein
MCIIRCGIISKKDGGKHISSWQSLYDELFQAWQLSFIDDLLCDEVEEVTEACDDHPHVL